MATKKRLIIGNWKMNPDSPKQAVLLASKIKKVASRFSDITTVLCPPFIFIPSIISKSKVEVGGQDMSYEENGPYTGEVSALQLKNSGVSYVIIGHSERRKKGETEGVIAKKVLKAIATGITPVICIGEEVHDSDGAYLDIVRGQLLSSISLINKTEVWKVVFAYEPVWAVGATEAMTSYDLHQMSLYIKKVLQEEYGKIASGINILYGGSVDATNAKEIVLNGEVDGLLVGRVSLNAEHFISLLKSIHKS